ncbi:MAG: hypothetical protein ACHQQR_00775 [Gemmatimonadales bacterium]
MSKTTKRVLVGGGVAIGLVLYTFAGAMAKRLGASTGEAVVWPLLLPSFIAG